MSVRNLIQFAATADAAQFRSFFYYKLKAKPSRDKENEKMASHVLQ
jgi:hypothetical protein